VLTWSAILELASGLPEIEESTSYGTPALKVRGKLIARLWEDGETLVLRVGPEREALMLAEPEKFFTTAHYENYPWVLVRLARVGADELRELLTEAWHLRAPRRLAAQREAERDGEDD
jgi:hypothetical protein